MTVYVPILRWKRGEKVALRSLTSQGKTDVVPLIVLRPEQYVAKPATANRPGLTAEDAFAADLAHHWGSSPIFVDASSLPTGSTGVHPITAIAASARAAGLAIIPASKLGAPQTYRTAVAAVVAIDGRGAGLRVDLQELTTAASWVGGMLIPPAQTHLIADFADNVANVLALGNSVIAAFNGLHGAGVWLSVTVAGSSLPENFTGYAAGNHLISRAEWNLWQSLQASVPGYAIGYGDYTSVSLSAPPPGISWGYPINVKYTLDAHFLVCRGVKTTGPGSLDMDVQLIGHAGTIRANGSRNPLGHAWADGKVDRIAAQTEGPGNLETWVQIGVNRHIEKVRHDLP